MRCLHGASARTSSRDRHPNPNPYPNLNPNPNPNPNLTRPLTVPPEQRMANEEANRPNPDLCLSPIYRNMYIPGPDISEVG